MKKRISKKIFTIVWSTSLINFASPLFSSCSIISSNEIFARKLDGSDWQGVFLGKFYENDYIIDWDEKTVTYTHSLGLHAKDLVIPNYVDVFGQKFVVLLGENCFKFNNGISGTVELNDFISYIPDNCFCETVSLQKIIFHCPPIAFGFRAFYNSELSSITIKTNGVETEDWTSDLIYIGNEAFSYSWISGLLVFSPKLQYLGAGAFTECINLTCVDLSLCSFIKEIPAYCFKNCDAMYGIYFPSTIINIDEQAFEGCSALQFVWIPTEMNMSFGDYAFAQCINWIGFTQPINVDSVGIYTFLNDNKLQFELFSDDSLITEVPMGAFSECTQITSIVFNDNIKEVGDFAFSQCYYLSVLDFSLCSKEFLNSVSWTGRNIFSSCASNGTIYLASGDMLNEDWINFLKANGIEKIGTDEREGWVIRNIPFPSYVIEPEHSEEYYPLFIHINDSGSAIEKIQGFSFNSAYYNQPDLNLMTIKVDYEDVLPYATITAKACDYDTITKKFNIEFTCTNLPKGRFDLDVHFKYNRKTLGPLNYKITFYIV